MQQVLGWLLMGRGRKLKAELKQFFRGDLNDAPIVSRSFASVELPNLQLAIDHYVQATNASSHVVGYTSRLGNFQNDLRSLTGESALGAAMLSAAQYREVDIDVGE